MEFDEVPHRKDPADPNLIPMERDIINQLKTVFDPEIPVDIYELGLVYHIDFSESTGKVDVYMTLTAPGCPVAEVMPTWVKEAVEIAESVDECEVHMQWDPPWRMDMMSMRAKIELNMI